MGRGSTSPGTTGKLFYVKVVTKKGQDPHFALYAAGEKDGPVIKESKLSGFLIAGAHKTFTSMASGADMDSISLTLEDRDAGGTGETYKIEQLLSGTSRDIINKLLGVEEFLTRAIEIRLYTNDKGYATTWIGFEGDREGFKWTYDYEFTKSKISTSKKKEKVDGKIVEVNVNDYLELNEFFIQEFKDKVVPKLKGGSAPARRPDGTDTPIDGPKDDAGDDEGSELPF